MAEEAGLNPGWLLTGEGPELRGAAAPNMAVADAVRANIEAELRAQGATDRELGILLPTGDDLLSGLVRSHLRRLRRWRKLAEGMRHPPIRELLSQVEKALADGSVYAKFAAEVEALLEGEDSVLDE